MIEQTIIDRILEAADIVEVIGQYVNLRKRGVNYWGICPFHADRSPSMCVSPSKNIFKCFACGTSGNAISFLQQYENISFPEAVRILAKKYNIEIPEKEMTPDEIEQMKEKESVRVVTEAASVRFVNYLESSDQAKDYLKTRGWNVGVDQTLELYRVGYAPDEWRRLLSDLKKSAYSIDKMIAAGVVSKGEKATFDSFRNRIIFPYFDLRGNVIGFTGRLIVPSDKAPKYYNTSETEIFHKGNVLFGLFQARQAISQNDKLYFVEGQFDVLSMVRAGIRNTICGSGTALTDTQVKTMLRFTNRVTLIYDSDAAGIHAGLKNLKSLLLSGAIVNVITLPEGEDPDSFVRTMEVQKVQMWLDNHENDWISYVHQIFAAELDDPAKKSEHMNFVAECIASVSDKSLRISYTVSFSKLFGLSVDDAKKLIRLSRVEVPEVESKSGFYGLEVLSETLPDKSENCLLTVDFKVFSDQYGDEPVIYMVGEPSFEQIQELRRNAAYFVFKDVDSLTFTERDESAALKSLIQIFKAGFIVYIEQLDEYGVACSTEFVDYYVGLYGRELDNVTGDIKAVYYTRCAEVISYASDVSRAVQEKTWSHFLHLTSKAYKELLKPFLERRKAQHAIAQQKSYDDSLLFDDPEIIPDYVEENEEYQVNYKRYGFYPLLNKDRNPVCYMFRNTNGSGHTQIADFYMEPLIHIYDTDPEYNKRVFKIYRRYFKNPIYLEIKSKALASLQSFEEVLVNEEAMNFDNGEVRHFKKIRAAMSYKYIKCAQIKTYGQQQEGFFAFSNAIFHQVDGIYKVDMVSDLGVVSHEDGNYYLPAFSSINTGVRTDNDNFESLRYFVYKNIPAEQQCNFTHWAELMNKVYPTNDNGKWAIIYAIMCAFRSDIHAIDRLFTALFFVGPTMSGKTQIAVSIRSLYIDPDLPCFNLNTGTDAAFFSLMEGFRDVPQVLEEYNNKDISDSKFQGLKSVTYDGDGKQKRKGTSGKDIETSKVYSPVIIAGQETPQRDDNALMNRVVICEVPKKTAPFTAEEKAIFEELKMYEKNGLCNILFEILKLRPIVQQNYKKYVRSINKDLTASVLVGTTASGDMTRIINTITLFLAMCKLLEEQAPTLKLPFTYEEFYAIARKKVITQVEMISRTDKLAGFFKAMDVLINNHAIIDGRDYAIDQPTKLTLKQPGNEKNVVDIPFGTKVLYLRISTIFSVYQERGFNSEAVTQSTIAANIRSNPAYLGEVNARRFRWKESVEKAKNTLRGDGTTDNTMVRMMETRTTMTSCIAMRYDIFQEYFDIDLERADDEVPEDPEKKDTKKQDLPF